MKDVVNYKNEGEFMKKLVISLLSVLMVLGLMMPVSALTGAEVAQIGDAKYSTLQEAFDAAKDGDVIALLDNADVNTTAPTDSRYSLMLKNKSVTLDGGNYTINLLSGTRGIYLEGGNDASAKSNVVFKNVKINNALADSRCIDTRGGHFSLTLENVALSTEQATGNSQPLTVGGNSHEHKNDIIIKNSSIKANDAGYAYISFNPANVTVDNSKMNGYASFYFKGPLGSYGSKTSVVNVINGSEISSVNPHGAGQNDFATVVFEDSNIEFNLVDSVIKLDTSAESTQRAFSFQENPTYNIDANDCTVNISGAASGIVTGPKSIFQEGAKVDGNEIKVSSGVFNTVDVLEHLAPNADVTVRLDSNVEKSIVIPQNTTVTLDLNGNNITGTSGHDTISNSGNLTIVDNGIVDHKSSSNKVLTNVRRSGAVATIKGGEFTRSQESDTNFSNAISNGLGCTINFEDGKVNATSNQVFAIENNGEMNIKGGTINAVYGSIENGDTAVLNISGGTISSEGDDAINSYGEVVVDGGEINGRVVIGTLEASPSKATINSGTINGDVIAKKGFSVNVIVNGGHISGKLQTTDANFKPLPEDQRLNIDVNAGTFGTNVSDYVVPGKMSVGVDGLYYVGEGETLQPIIDNAKNTVEVLGDTTDIKVPVGVEVTNKTGNDIVVNGHEVKAGQTIIAKTAPVVPVCKGPKDKNCDGVVTCEEEMGKGWTWNNSKKVCEYTGSYVVVNTAAK